MTLPFTYSYPEELPIVSHRKKIIETIKSNQVVIIAGETGSGKTTQLPKMCLEAGRGRKKIIACTQPRRLATMAVAERVTEEMGQQGKDLVGYRIRFQDRTGAQTRVKFLTDGMLLAETQHDRRLFAYDTIIIDEAHERSLNIDFIIGILKKTASKRKDLKIIISSATLDVQKFSKHFNNAPVIEVSGRSFPIEDVFLQQEDVQDKTDSFHIEQAVKTVASLDKDKKYGDVLIFMPTERDILEVADLLKNNDDTTVVPLFGRMSGKEQKRIFSQVKGRKVVVATNVAETSITVPGIRYVIDSGLARISGYNARARTTKLPVRPISRASIKQRRGRCGRVGPGVCYYLYTEEDYLNRPEFTPPEIVRSNLAEVILRMSHLQLGHPVKFPFIDMPNTRSIRDGFKLLEELGAINVVHRNKNTINRLTKRGQFMARLPVDPRISRMIIEARGRNCLAEVLVVASALSIQDPRTRPLEKTQQAASAHEKFIEPGSDFLSYLKIWNLFHQTSKKVQSKTKLRKFCKTNFLAYQRMREWCDIYDQLLQISKKAKFIINTVPAKAESIHQAILSGSLRNIAMKKQKNIYLGAQGKELMVFPGSSLFNKSGKWIMAAEAIETNKLYARTIATIEPEWIEPLADKLCRYSYSDPHWEKKRGQVVAKERVTLFGLVISANRKVNYGKIRQEESRHIFIQSCLVEGEVAKKYDFHEHNAALIKQYQNMEERLRRRGVVDDYLIFNFYDNRLPDDIVDIATLEAFLDRVPKKLYMQDVDILQNSPDFEQLKQFPGFIECEQERLALSYCFSPGSNEDGVTVHVPVDLVHRLEPSSFEWLVPGMIQEKIHWLIKGLPKKIRKKLVPVSESSEKIVRRINFGEGQLLTALETLIWKHFQVKVSRRDWQLDNLPPHLHMRFCLCQGKRQICFSRRMEELLEHKSEVIGANSLARLQKKYERTGIKDWSFSRLPRQIPVSDKTNSHTGFVYPGILMGKDETVSIKLYTTEQERDRNTRETVMALYKLPLKRQVKEASRRFALCGKDFSLCEGLGEKDEINSYILEFILREQFRLNNDNIPSELEHRERINTLRKGSLLIEGQLLFDKIKNILIVRKSTLEQISKFQSKTIAGSPIPKKRNPVDNPFACLSAVSVKNNTATKEDDNNTYFLQAERLLSIAFFKEHRIARMELLERYFKALRIRVERAYVSPSHDKQKWLKALVFEEKVREAEKLLEIPRLPKQQSEFDKLVEELWIMVEEFKVSLFAQELGTSIPISEKRLELKWKEIQQWQV